MKNLKQKDLEGVHLYVVASGVGTKLQDELWMIPGTSSFLVGASFPYSTDDTDEFLGFKPASYCSREESLQLAMEAFMRARRHGLSGTSKTRGRPIGLAVTGAVASVNGPLRRGEHRLHVAVVTEGGAIQHQVTLPKEFGAAAREMDNNVASLEAGDILALALNGTLTDLVVEERELRETFFKHPYFSQSGARFPGPRDVGAYLPGSFNPLHEAHQLLAAENDDAGDAVAYMICADNVHKKPLAVTDMLLRAAQFRLERQDGNVGRVLFTQGDPLFVDKFRRFPGSKFILGVDTFVRMMDPKWGPGRDEIIACIKENDISVAVSDRVEGGITTRAADAIERLVPPMDWGLFEIIDTVTVDVSSSELRRLAVC